MGGWGYTTYRAHRHPRKHDMMNKGYDSYLRALGFLGFGFMGWASSRGTYDTSLSKFGGGGLNEQYLDVFFFFFFSEKPYSKVHFYSNFV